MEGLEYEGEEYHDINDENAEDFDDRDDHEEFKEDDDDEDDEDDQDDDEDDDNDDDDDDDDDNEDNDNDNEDDQDYQDGRVDTSLTDDGRGNVCEEGEEISDDEQRHDYLASLLTSIEEDDRQLYLLHNPDEDDDFVIHSVEEEYRRQVEDEDYEYLLSVEAALDRDCDFCDFAFHGDEYGWDREGDSALEYERLCGYRYTSTPPP